MKHNAHVSGPWTVDNGSRVLLHKTPGVQANIEGIRILADGRCVAEVIALSDQFPSSNEKYEATARLVAAAPDMLAALQALYTRPNYLIPGDRITHEMVNAVNDAIAKATGGAK